MALRALGCREVCNAWVGQVLRCVQSFFAGSFGVTQLPGHQKAVGRNAQASVVVEPAPAPAFVVSQSQILLQILVIALNLEAASRMMQDRYRTLGYELMDLGPEQFAERVRKEGAIWKIGNSGSGPEARLIQ